MPFFTFTTTVPAANNAPASDQPLMQVNNASTNSIINVDHYTFNNNSGGLHKQVTMPVESIPASAVGQAVLYANTAGQSQLFATTDNGGNAYQLSRFIDANFVSFGQSINYAPPVANQNGGWTFLPGGLLLQYGSMLSTGSNTVVVFPIPFTTALYSLTYSFKQTAANANTYGFQNESTTGFTFTKGTSAAGSKFFWMAIGV